MLADYLTPFALLARDAAPDGLGGTEVALQESLIFQGGVTFVPGGEVTVAGLSALRTVPVLVHDYDVTLRPGDVVRRQSDGAVYRVAGHSRDMRTPATADLRFAQVPVEILRMSSKG